MFMSYIASGILVAAETLEWQEKRDLQSVTEQEGREAEDGRRKREGLQERQQLYGVT